MSDPIRFEARTNCELRGDRSADCRRHWQRVLRLRDSETDLGEFDVVYCNLCKLGWTNPFPTEDSLNALYDARESSDFDVVRGSVVDLIKDFLSVRQLRRLAPRESVGAVLDYGTGNGRFAISAAKAFPGARVDAVDYHAAPPSLLQDPRLSSISYYNVEELFDLRRRYQLIILRHVLEHNHHPVNLLRDLSQLLAEDGIIYVEVPNLHSGCGRVFRHCWNGYYVPRHVFHFTSLSLAEAASLAGLEVVMGRNEMPAVGNAIAIFTGARKSNLAVQLAGIALHPLQLLIEALHGSSTCIHARCWHRLPVDIGE